MNVGIAIKRTLGSVLVALAVAATTISGAQTKIDLPTQTKGILPSANGGTGATGFAQSGTGAVLRSWTSKGQDTINAKDFGVTCDGATNDTTNINAVLTAGAGKTINFPPGNCLYDGGGTLANGTVLVGAGRNATFIYATSAAATLFTASGYGSGIRGISFTASVTQTGGSYVVLSGSESFIDDFAMSGDYNGILMTGNVSRIRHGRFQAGASGAIRIRAEGGDNSQLIEDVLMGGQSPQISTAGIRVRNSSGLIIGNTSVINQTVGLLIDPYTTTQGVATDAGSVFSVEVHDCLFDNNATNAIRIVPSGTGGVVRSRFANTWGSSSGSDGVDINNTGSGTISGIHFVSPHLLLNGGSGLTTLGTVSDISILGGEIGQNTFGVYLNTGLTGLHIEGATIGTGAGVTGNTSGGIVIASGVDQIRIVGNDVRGNGAAISNSGGANQAINSNLGIDSVSAAASTFTGTATFGTITASSINGTITSVTGLTPSSVGLGSVTNDAQTKASIVPNTVPSAGKILVGNAGGTAYAPVALSGPVSITSAGVTAVSTLNQSTTGSAASLTTPRSIYGNNFDGSAALSQIIASTFGGTGNGFTKFSGPATAEKTFTLPNASATVLTDNALVTVAQGGTGLNTLALNRIFYGNGASALQSSANFTFNGTTLAVSSGGSSAAGSFTSSGSGNTLLITDVGASGAAIGFVGDGVNPNKWIRIHSGNLDFINSAYTATIGQFDDVGNFWAKNSIGVNNLDASGWIMRQQYNSSLSNFRTLTWNVHDADRVIDLAGNLTLAASLSTSGANTLTFTTTGATNVTLPTTGTVATLTSYAGLGAITTSSSTAGVGYATGAGGTVTQVTTKATGVTLSKPTGQITMNNAALAAGAKVFFTVTNTLVAATDVPVCAVASGGTANAYRVWVSAVAGAGGTYTVGVENVTAGSLSEAPVLNCNLIKGVSS